MIEKTIELIGEIDTGANGGAVSYDYLANKPTINNVELSGNITFDDLGVVEITNEELDSMFENL